MKTRYLMLLLVIVSFVFAHPNTDASYGLFRSISADNGSAGHFHIGFYGRTFAETRDARIVGDSTGEANHTGHDLFFGLGYAITDNFSFNVASSFHGDGVDYTNIDYNRASMGLGNTKIGFKLGLGSERIKFGVNPFISLPTGADRSTALENKSYPVFGDAYGNDGGVFRYFSSGGTDYGVIGLLTINANPIVLDFNLGYVDKNKNDDVLGWRNNYTIYNVALSLCLGSVVPFIEIGGIDFSGEDEFITFTDDPLFGPNAVFVTPGISFRPGNFNINLAADIRAWEGENARAFPTATTDSFNITTGWGVAPPWAGILGISYCHDFMPEKPETGKIAGSVIDTKTKDPIEANVGVYEDNTLVTSSVSDADGTFKFSDLEPGTYKLSVSATDYLPYNVDLFVKAGETTPINVELIRAQGDLVLNIFDLKTENPMTATITIGTEEPEVITGNLTKTLKAGTYTIKAIAKQENYLPFEKTVTIEGGEILEIDVALVKKAFKIVLPQVYFETAKAEIKPESYPVLDDAAKTIKLVLGGSPTTKLEIQGHTDNRGTDEYNMTLSENRAGSVKDYLVTKHGIEGARLVAKGYGESKPVASNNTEEGQTKNRRVEFVILK